LGARVRRAGVLEDEKPSYIGLWLSSLLLLPLLPLLPLLLSELLTLLLPLLPLLLWALLPLLLPLAQSLPLIMQYILNFTNIISITEMSQIAGDFTSEQRSAARWQLITGWFDQVTSQVNSAARRA
jgi:hypothetical protein